LLGIYQKLLPLLRWLLEFLAPRSPKIEAILAPRRGLLERWRKATLGENRIWFHVSSVGELEQARPVMERLKTRGYSIVITYFSSSVPRLVKEWGFVTHADYLPLDFPEEMEELVEIIRPRLLVLNRYDLWPNHLLAARRREIPVVVVNASTPPLGWFGAFSLYLRRDLFLMINAWAFVDSAAAANWEPHVSRRVKGLVTGDPRVDRALVRVEQALREGKSRERIALWRKQAFCLVAGSSWPEDEQLLFEAWGRLDFPRSLLVVPHEPEDAHLKKIEKRLDAAGLTHGRFSRLTGAADWDVLLVDQRGMLAELYALGQLAYVGGGFRRQIHSIVEPVAHGLPVVFGPNFRRSPEAVALSATEAALALPKSGAADALTDWLRRLAFPGPERGKTEEPLRVFLQIHRGAGERVADFVHECVLSFSPR
jgi:3-deoxy-D-manno-octulosonic-acid transferase